MLVSSAANDIVLTEDDVPGASLDTRQPEQLTVPELKHRRSMAQALAILLPWSPVITQQ